VQVGWVNQRAFLVNASVGLYPKLLADREAAKQKLGRRRWIAMLVALKSLLEWRLQLVLDAELDGRSLQLRAASVFVCNNQLQLERIGVEPDVVAQTGEGRLACLLLPAMGTWAKLRMLAGRRRRPAGRRPRDPQLHPAHAGRRYAPRAPAQGGHGWRGAMDGTAAALHRGPRPAAVMLPPPEQRLPPR
jgi:hypothetical protein